MVFEVLIAAALMQAPAAPEKPEEKPTAAALTQVEILALENIDLKLQLAEAVKVADACRAEIGPMRSTLNAQKVSEQAAKLKSALESVRPGFVWDWQKKAFVFVAKPVPVEKKAPASPPVEK